MDYSNALGNIVCKLSNIVIIKIYEVTLVCKLKDPRLNTKKYKLSFLSFHVLLLLIII